MTSTDLVSTTPGEGLSAHVSATLDLLQNATPDEAKAIAEDAQTLIELVRRRGWALDEINQIARVKVTAERKIGEQRIRIPRTKQRREFSWNEAKLLHDQGLSHAAIARQLGTNRRSVGYASDQNFGADDMPLTATGLHMTIAEFDSQLGLDTEPKRRRLVEWQALAHLPDSEFEDVLVTIQEKEIEITTTRVLYEARIKTADSADYVERGLRRMRDGRYRIRYTKHGKEHQETLKTSDITTARRVLLERRGSHQPQRKQAVARVDAAYNDLRVCLDRIGRCLPDLAPDSRKAAEEAIGHGHRMEDALTRCLKLT